MTYLKYFSFKGWIDGKEADVRIHTADPDWKISEQQAKEVGDYDFTKNPPSTTTTTRRPNVRVHL